MLKISTKGNWANLTTDLERLSEWLHRIDFDKYGREGVDALKKATPVDTGATAELWRYEIHRKKDTVELVFCNDSNSNGVPIVILLQYGHVSRNGGWVMGEDFVNPALQPVLKRLNNEIRKGGTVK